MTGLVARLLARIIGPELVYSEAAAEAVRLSIAEAP